MIKKRIKKIIKSDWVIDKAVRLFNYVERESIKRDTDKHISKMRRVGVDSKFNGNIRIIYPKNIIIGNNVHIGDGSFLDGRGGIIIGNNTDISRNLTLYSSNHNYNGTTLPYDQTLIAKEVIIGKNVWIGMDVCITPGVHINDGAIIGLGAVISKDVAAGEFVVSNPQRATGSRDKADYNRKVEKSLYGGISGQKILKDQIKSFLIAPLEAQKVVFVLSTGRAGSQTIAKMFKADSAVSAFHETFYYLINRMSVEYLAGKITRDKVKQKLILYFKNASFIKPDTLYLESDQMFSPFIQILEEIFDTPKYIWLIRHPKTFMHSATSRGWFAEGRPDFREEKVLIDPQKSVSFMRITGDLTEDYTESDWQHLDQRKKVLWYWKYWNGLIKDGLDEIPDDRKLFLQLEKLNEEQSRILDFMDLKDDKKVTVSKTNAVRKKDARLYDQTKENNYKFFEDEGFKAVEKEMESFGYDK